MATIANLPSTSDKGQYYGGWLTQNGNGQYSTGNDTGMEQWFATYFNGSNAPTSQYGPGHRDQRGHYNLPDHKAVLADLEPVIYKWITGALSFINNPDFFPAFYSEKLEFSQSVVEFSGPVYVEEEPEESVARTFGIKRSQITFRCKRYGLAYEWSVDNMMRPEGREEFLLFTGKISNAFAENIAMLSLMRLLEPRTEDVFYMNLYGGSNYMNTMKRLEDEKDKTFSGHKTSAGIFPVLWTEREDMIRKYPDGGAPNYCMIDGRYQVMWKFNMERVSDVSRAGPSALGMLTGTTVLDDIQGMKVVTLPPFATDTWDGEEGIQLLNRSVRIGNFHPWRNKMLDFKPEAVNIATQGYIYLLDEPSNLNPVKKSWVDLNRADFHWDTNGRFKATLDGEENHPFTYLNQYGDWVRARYIGDFKPHALNRRIINGMVQTTMNHFRKMGIQDIINKIKGGVVLTQDESRMFHAFVKKLEKLFGGSNNIVFNDENLVAVNGNETTDQKKSRSVLLNLFGIDAFAPVVAPAPGVNLVFTAGLSDENLVVSDQHFAQFTAGLADVVSTTDGKYEVDQNFKNLMGNVGSRLAQLKTSINRIANPAVAAPAAIARPAAFGAHDVNVAAIDVGIGAFDVPAGDRPNPKTITTAAPTPERQNSMVQIIDRMIHNAFVYQSLNEGDSCNLSVYNAYNLDQLIMAINGAAGLNAAAKLAHVPRLDAIVTIMQAVGQSVTVEDQLKSAREHFYQLGVDNAADVQDLATRLVQGNIVVADIENLLQVRSLPTDKPVVQLFDTAFRNVKKWDVYNYSDVRTRYGQGKRNPMANERSTRRYDLKAVSTSTPSVGDNDNFSENVAKAAMEISLSGDVERAIFFCILATPCMRDVYENLLVNDIFVPVEYVLHQPNKVYRTSSPCMVQGGKDLGFATYAYPNCALAMSAMNMTGYLHVTEHHGAVLKNPKRRRLLFHVLYRDTMGGSSARFMTRREFESLKDNQWEWGGEESAGSIIPISVSVGSYIAEEKMDVRGKFFPEQETTLHYETAGYLTKELGLADIVSSDHLTIMERTSRPVMNTVEWRGTSAQADSPSGEPRDIRENLGHHGMERPGDNRMRRGGLEVRSGTIPPLFN